mmetsp:Transcript_39314/g.102924  ORF Transcript_39314/g.102924 Transcript_39314/m.102924 type:complete len:330 (-) Transcript_39314:124-1113(-)
MGEIDVACVQTVLLAAYIRQSSKEVVAGEGREQHREGANNVLQDIYAAAPDNSEAGAAKSDSPARPVVMASYSRYAGAAMLTLKDDGNDRNSATTAASTPNSETGGEAPKVPTPPPEPKGNVSPKAQKDKETAVPHWVTATQSSLGSIVSGPELSTAALEKPTVSFVRDVFRAVYKAAGCGEGLFTDAELEAVSENANTEIKRTMLHKLVDFVANVTESDLSSFVVEDCIAGTNPEQTNLLLQKLHAAATDEAAKTRWGAGVKLAEANHQVRVKDDQIVTLKTEVQSTKEEQAEGGGERPKSPAGSALNAVRAKAEEKAGEIAEPDAAG